MTDSAESTSQTTAPDPAWARWVHRLSYGLAWFGAISALLMALNVIVDVLGRTFFGHSLPGTLDLITYWWMPLTCLLPLGLVEVRREHVSVNIITERLTGALALFVTRFGLVLTLGAAGALTYFAFGAAMEKLEIGERALSVAWLPVWPMRFVVVLALAAWFLEILVALIASFSRRPRTSALATGGENTI